jgi:hypothetical protein
MDAGTGNTGGASNVGSQSSNVGSSSVGSSSSASHANSSSGSGGSTQATTGANQAGALSSSTQTAGTPSAAPEYFEVKVNGKSVKMTRDEVLAHAAKAQAADQRFEEAARLRRESQAFEENLKKNKIQALIDRGFTKDQIRDEFEKWYSQEFIEPETLTADQKRARDMERELLRYKQAEKEAQEKAQLDQEAQMTSQQREYFSQQIIDAMDKSGLPKTKFFAQRMAFYMRENLVKGWEAPLDLIVSQVKSERKTMMADLTESASVDQLIEMLGEGVINKIRKHDLEQLRSRRQNQGMQSSETDGYGNPTSGDKKTYSDVNRYLREMRLGKR